MPAPVIAAAINPVNIDPGVAYTYVIPVTGETSMGYTPDANFTLAIAGRVLTVTYTGPRIVVATTFPISIFASNGDGTSTQTINFSVQAPSIVTSNTFTVTATGGSSGQDLDFGSAIAGRLVVGDVVVMQNTGGVEAILKVSYVSGSVFHVDSSGTTQTYSAGTYHVRIAIVQTRNNNTDTIFWVGDTSALTVNQPLKLAFEIGSILSAYRGVLYVSQILDSYRVTLSTNAGGAPFNEAGVYVVISDVTDNLGGGVVITFSGAGGRQFPKITTSGFLSVNAADAIDETLTADISFDESFCFGLPTGLSLAGNHITGSVATSGYYPVILELRKGTNVSKRYFVLTVAAVSGGGGSPESSLSGRRIALSLQSGLVMESASARRNVNPLAVALGDGPIVVDIVDGAIQPDGATHGTLQFGAKATLASPGSTVDWDGDFIVFGSIDITDVVAAGTQQTLVPNEDWSADELVALFDAEQDIIRLGAQFRWRNGDTPAGKWYRSRPFQVSVSDTIFRSDLVSSLSALFVQRKPFAALTGGGDDKLDGALTARLAIDTWLAYVVRTISGLRSASKWFLVAWDTTTAAADETTSGDRGIVIPVDFDAGTNAKMWVRVDGL